MSEFEERLDKVRALVQDPEFLEGKGLSNEVNIRIFCYEPENEMIVPHFSDIPILMMYSKDVCGHHCTYPYRLCV